MTEKLICIKAEQLDPNERLMLRQGIAEITDNQGKMVAELTVGLGNGVIEVRVKPQNGSGHDYFISPQDIFDAIFEVEGMSERIGTEIIDPNASEVEGILSDLYDEDIVPDDGVAQDGYDRTKNGDVSIIVRDFENMNDRDRRISSGEFQTIDGDDEHTEYSNFGTAYAEAVRYVRFYEDSIILEERIAGSWYIIVTFHLTEEENVIEEWNQ